MSSDKEYLELLYSPSRWTTRFSTHQEVIENHVKIVTRASEAAVKDIPHELDIEYGKMSRQKLDIFGTDLPNGKEYNFPDAPIFVYIHGGYWQKLSREQSRYTVKPLYNSQIKTIVVGYELCPSVSLPDIVRHTVEAVTFIFEYAKAQGSRGLYFAGHSAGAHLLAMIFSNAHLVDRLPNFSCLRGLFLISGVYDLQDLVKTYVNDVVNLPHESAVAFSPICQEYGHLSDKKVQIYVLVGENESPEFKNQSKDFCDLLIKEYSPLYTHLVIKDSYDHFNIVESLSEENNYLKCLLLENFNSYK